jgi:hypothetical protein
MKILKITNKEEFIKLSEFEPRIKELNVQKLNRPYLFMKKGVKDNNFHSKLINKYPNKIRLKKVINTILEHNHRKRINKLNLSENCKDWIDKILNSNLNNIQNYLGFLLRDFTNHMNTRMREAGKYVIAIIFENQILIVHSIFGKSTITPNCNVIERMLDRDNIMRYVLFKKDGLVLFFEFTAPSIFLSDWLGLREDDSSRNYRGSTKFYTEFNGIPLILMPEDSDIQRIIHGSHIFKYKNNTLTLVPDISIRRFDITKIKRGKKTYEDLGIFFDEHLASNYNLLFYQKKYKELLSSLDVFINNYYDDETELIIEKGKNIKKESSKFSILFCNGLIKIHKRFLEKIKNKFINNEQIKIYHLGCQFSLDFVRIKNLEIFNVINLKICLPLINYYNNNYDEAVNIFLRAAIFNLLYEFNKSKPISYFFKEMYKELVSEIKITYNAQIFEDDLIELKSRDFLSGNNNEIISKLEDDLRNKLYNKDLCLYLIGYDERIKEYEPIPINRFDDSRIHLISKKIKSKLGLSILKKDLSIPLFFMAASMVF